MSVLLSVHLSLHIQLTNYQTSCDSDIFQKKYVTFDEPKYYCHTLKVMMCFE